MAKKKIRVLVVSPKEEPKVAEIENNYRAMQKVVDGRIQFMPFDANNENCELMVDEEYLMNGKELNRFVQSDFHCVEDGSATVLGVPVMGTFAVVRNNPDTGGAISLTDDDITKYQQMFRL